MGPEPKAGTGPRTSILPDPKAPAGAAPAAPTAASQNAAFNNLMGKAPAPAPVAYLRLDQGATRWHSLFIFNLTN